MTKKLGYHRFLGLPREASPEEAMERCQELLTWLRSPAVPLGLYPWAVEQATIVEGFYRSLSQRDDVEEAETEIALEEAAPPGKLRRRLRGPLGFALIGIVLGLLVVGGVFWFRQGEEPAPPTAAQEEPLSSQDFLATHGPRLAELQALIALDPSNVEALFELGETYMSGEEWESAIRWFSQLLAIKPDVHAQTDVALAHMFLGRDEEAEAAFLKALDIDSTYPTLHYGMGWFYATGLTPDPMKAAQHWQEVIRLDPGSELAATAKTHLEQMGLATPSP